MASLIRNWGILPVCVPKKALTGKRTVKTSLPSSTKPTTMFERGDGLEAAIPPHLQVPRTQPLHQPPGFEGPKFPSYSARFHESVTKFVSVELGIQYPGGTDAAAAINVITAGIRRPFGPQHHLQSSFKDAAGFVNDVFTLYWRDITQYQQWHLSMDETWWHAGLSLDGAIGAFKEAYLVPVTDIETTFALPSREGCANVADSMSNLTDTHEYLGSARDRIPRSQTQDLAPFGWPSLGGTVRPKDSRGRLLVVHPHDNLCLIRSGQVWEGCEGKEVASYENAMKPLLDRAMEEVVRDGSGIGCLFNRYMRVKDEEGRPMNKTWSVSAWESLKRLEEWTRTPRHMEIFRSGMKHPKRMEEDGIDSRLNTWHELMVLSAADQSFSYFNCHKQTGLLSAIF